MKKKVTFVCFVTVFFVCVLLGLAACGGGQKAQQQPNQQAPQKAAGSSGSDTERGLVGTWEVVEADPAAMVGGLWTFSSDGTFQDQPFPEDDPDLLLPAKYRADGSYIHFIDPETGGEMMQTEYTLNGDTLRTHAEVADPEFPVAQTSTFKRKS